jgi:hypothetical protein
LLEKAKADAWKILSGPERRGSEPSPTNQGGDHTQQDLHIQETSRLFHIIRIQSVGNHYCSHLDVF